MTTRAGICRVGGCTTVGSPTVVAGGWVVALDAATYAVAGGAVARADGRYHLEVPPGDYVVEVIDPSGDRLPQWFDGHPASSLGDADPVTVEADATTTVDPALTPVRGAIVGTVTADGGGGPVESAWVAAVDSQGRLAGGTRTDAAGGYALPGLVTGGYYLVFVDPVGGHAFEFFDDAASITSATPVVVTGGATATADAALAPP